MFSCIMYAKLGRKQAILTQSYAGSCQSSFSKNIKRQNMTGRKNRYDVSFSEVTLYACLLSDYLVHVTL